MNQNTLSKTKTTLFVSSVYSCYWIWTSYLFLIFLTRIETSVVQKIFAMCTYIQKSISYISTKTPTISSSYLERSFSKTTWIRPKKKSLCTRFNLSSFVSEWSKLFSVQGEIPGQEVIRPLIPPNNKFLANFIRFSKVHPPFWIFRN